MSLSEVVGAGVLAFSFILHSCFVGITDDSCDDLIAEENDILKLKVKRLEQKVKVLEKQAKVRPPQDNHKNMTNKLEKGSNFTKRASQQSNKAQPLKR
jgi:hypothetical protein